MTLLSGLRVKHISNVLLQMSLFLNILFQFLINSEKCVLPELKGRVCTLKLQLKLTSNDAKSMAAEKDQGRRCYLLQSEKGEDNDNKSYMIKQFHIES